MPRKKSSEPSIPKDYKTLEDKIDYVKDQIEEILPELDSVEKQGAEYAVQLGRWYIKLKKLVKKKKKTKWKDFVKKTFPRVTIRTIQRHMRIAEKVDLVEAPALGFLGQTRLYELAYLARNDSVAGFLEENEIDPFVDLEDQDSIDSFKYNVDEFVYNRKNKKRGKAKDAKAKDAMSKADDDNDDGDISIDDIYSMDEDELVNLLEKNGVDLDDDDWKSKKQLRKLLIDSLGLSDKDNDDNDNDDNDDDDNDNDNDNDDNDNNDDDDEFRESASLFVKSIDSVIKRQKTVKRKQKAKLIQDIEKIVQEVESKLKELKNYQKALQKKKSKSRKKKKAT